MGTANRSERYFKSSTLVDGRVECWRNKENPLFFKTVNNNEELKRRDLYSGDEEAILLYVPLDLEQQKYIFLVLQVQVFKTKYATYI